MKLSESDCTTYSLIFLIIVLQSDGTSDEVKREQMERLVREELERWDSETSFTPQPSGRGASPSSTGRGGPRSRSRPGSGGNAVS